MSEAFSPLSENVQMYLVNILRLSRDGQPVPLTQLAAALNVSPISVNQMCRKLQEDGLVTYVPYKGVSIAPAGEQPAAHVLRRHRLWEVFLVEKLQMPWEEAHDTACRLEHATPDQVIDRLDLFLDHPRVNPQGDPIPSSSGGFPAITLHPLHALEAGAEGHCVRCTTDEAACAFLAAQGLRPGAFLRVAAMAPSSLLIEVGGQRIAVDRALAENIWVEKDK